MTVDNASVRTCEAAAVVVVLVVLVERWYLRCGILLCYTTLILTLTLCPRDSTDSVDIRHH
jgi:hypothetical protein